VRELERTRSLAVDGAAAVLRQVERNLHDGAQVRLTSLALHLGMARAKAGCRRPQRAGLAALTPASAGFCPSWLRAGLTPASPQPWF